MMVDPKDIPGELIDALLANYQKPDDLLGKNGILEQMTKSVVERALQGEMTHHLGHEKHDSVSRGGPLCSDRKQRFLSLSFFLSGCLY